MSAWSEGRPIYGRLPSDAEKYNGNPAVDAICQPFDAILMQYKAAIDNFSRDFLDPDTARSDALDWLAQNCGFTGNYWDPLWGDAQKRLLIKNSHSFIWNNKGTTRLLIFLLSVFQINATIYSVGEFLADINAADDVLGGGQLQYFLLMPITYKTTSKEWRLVEQLNKNFMPVFCNSAIVYESFFADLSACGDPIL